MLLVCIKERVVLVELTNEDERFHVQDDTLDMLIVRKHSAILSHVTVCMYTVTPANTHYSDLNPPLITTTSAPMDVLEVSTFQSLS